ncbi:hypothetical protein [Kineococcus aurantiacus]|uniref:Glyoxalase-like domain-containing protein n=1 Tax=Kineococcus aurantiacus TaxID=37633 RepID=A0A7Y9AW40_9ACTN|nr:hypothetical protein [Kineococcus aurantiacus]NYD21930.1 hypothetical protein [Kineococcus aurantiacus]
MSAAARLTEVEFSTPAPGADAEVLVGLGFVPSPGPGAAGGGDVHVLRTCTDPHGCRVVLRPGPRAAVTRLTWRPVDGDHLRRMVGVVEGRAGLEGAVVSSGWAGEDYRVVHPGGAETLLHWRQDREWVAGAALTCPLHPDGSTRLCVQDPPLVLGVDVPVPDEALERWTSWVLGVPPVGWAAPGRGQGPRLRSAPGGAAGLRVGSDRWTAVRRWTSPGGLGLEVVAGEADLLGSLESEAFF